MSQIRLMNDGPGQTPTARFDRCMGPARVQLFQGDCIEGLARLEPGAVDVVVTSPPYNLGIRYGAFDDTMPRQDYLDWTRAWAGAVARVLSPRGSLFLNVGGKPSDPWVPHDVARCFRDLFQLQNTIHWIKSVAIDADASANASHAGAETRPGVVQMNLFDDPGPISTINHREGVGSADPSPARSAITHGHYKPIHSDRFLNDCHEYIFHFTRSGAVPLDRLAVGVPYQDKTNVARWRAAGADLRCRGNTWFIPYKTIQRRDEQRPHPATFPDRLPEMCILLHGRDRARLVLDPFVGLGSSAIAAVKLGLDFIGYDIDPQYLDVACERLSAIDENKPPPEASSQLSLLP